MQVTISSEGDDGELTKLTDAAGVEREERKKIRRQEKEKKVTRAEIEPTAAAPSQPARQDVSRSDDSTSFHLLFQTLSPLWRSW